MHRIPCPQCGHRLKYLDEQVGKRARCQKCGTLFVLPPPGDAVPAPPVEAVLEPEPERPRPRPAPRRGPPQGSRVPFPGEGVAVLAYGALNGLLLLLVLAVGDPIRFGHGPNVIMPVEARATNLYVFTVVALLANGALAVAGIVCLVRSRKGVYAAMTLAGGTGLVNCAYWFTWNADEFAMIELGAGLGMILVAWNMLRRVIAPAEAQAEIRDVLGGDVSPVQSLVGLLGHEKASRRVEALRQLGDMGREAAEAVPAIGDVILRAVPPEVDLPGHCEVCGLKLTLLNRSLTSPRCGKCEQRLQAANLGGDTLTPAEVAAETLGRLGAVAAPAVAALKKGARSKNVVLADRCRKALVAITRARTA